MVDSKSDEICDLPWYLSSEFFGEKNVQGSLEERGWFFTSRKNVSIDFSPKRKDTWGRMNEGAHEHAEAFSHIRPGG